MLELGLVQQLGHPDTCPHMEPAGPADTIVRVMVRKEVYRKTIIAYMWWGRVEVCGIVVIGCVDVPWIMRFTLHDHRLGEAPLDRSPAGHHQPPEGSKVRDT